MTAISVLGLGSMGAALANCLINAGYEVYVWNRSQTRTEAFMSSGAKICKTADEAVEASEFVLICIKSHRQTVELIKDISVSLAGKTICDTSSGDSSDAEQLVSYLLEQGADYMLGMINAYPSGIGEADTTLLTVGGPTTWQKYGEIITTLGGKSAYVGEQPAALAALFAALFSVRQGFMFGMIYGALVCQKADIPMNIYSDQISASIKLVQGYYKLFSETVPDENYDDAEASMKVYALAQEDALNTFKNLGAPSEFVQLMYDNTKAAWDDGLGDKQLTALATYMARVD